MFDLTRLTDMVGDLIGQSDTGNGFDSILQQLSEHGIDASQLDNLDVQQFTELLSQNGIDLSELDVGQISQLAEQVGLELPAGELLERFGGGTSEQ
ncbi:MAG: hypothetical protein RIC14_01740 [Filomicrobium sp.]